MSECAAYVYTSKYVGAIDRRLVSVCNERATNYGRERDYLERKPLLWCPPLSDAECSSSLCAPQVGPVVPRRPRCDPDAHQGPRSLRRRSVRVNKEGKKNVQKRNNKT